MRRQRIALFAVVAVLAGGGSYGIAQALPVSGTGSQDRFGGPGGGRGGFPGGGAPGPRGRFGGQPPAGFGAGAPGAPGSTR